MTITEEEGLVRIKLPAGQVDASFLGRPPMVDDIIVKDSAVFEESHLRLFVKSLEIPGLGTTITDWQCSRQLDATLRDHQHHDDRILVLTPQESSSSSSSSSSTKEEEIITTKYRVVLPKGSCAELGLTINHIPPVLEAVDDNSVLATVLKPGLLIEEYSVPDDAQEEVTNSTTMGIATGKFTATRLKQAIEEHKDTENRVLVLRSNCSPSSSPPRRQQVGNFDWLSNWNSSHSIRWSFQTRPTRSITTATTAAATLSSSSSSSTSTDTTSSWNKRFSWNRSNSSITLGSSISAPRDRRNSASERIASSH